MITVLENADITYLENILLNENGELNIVSYNEKLKDIPQSHLSQFCVKHGVYNIPTIEMVEFLKNEIGKDIGDTIEIGAGNGVLAEHLGIKATDSMQQERMEVKAVYLLTGQTPVKYGKNVMQYDALSAIKLLKPKVILACWCTHIYNPLEPYRKGNQDGIDEEKVIKNVKKYIFIGNEETHKMKPILKYPHKVLKFDWIVSRSMNKDKNVIWIWEK